MLDFLLLLVSVVLIWIIFLNWSKTKQQSEPGGLEYARASDVYNKLLTNDNNVFKLMTDFSEPVKIQGPDGIDSENVESTNISLLDRLGL